MTTALKNIVSKLESLPLKEQNVIANLIQEELAGKKSYKKSPEKNSSGVAEPAGEYGLKSDLHILIDKINDNNMLNVIHVIASRFTGSKAATAILSASEKKAVDKAFKSVENGHTMSHEKVMAGMKKKYPSLIK